MSETDLQLLARYVQHRSEDAFAEVVRRHLDLVHSAAMRQVRSPELAEEVVQAVFLQLAKQADRLPPETVLAAWLYQVTRRRAIDVVRHEVARRVREQTAQELQAMHTPEVDWMPIAPHLDDAMEALHETDRTALLLRYFQNKPLREVGLALGVTDDAAQKRISRAIDRLRTVFASRGIAIGASSLTIILSTNSVQAAPVGLIKAVSMLAFAQGATSSGPILAFAKGLLKPLFTPSAALAMPFLGSVFFTLKAEVESAPSRRERQFIVRMIWLRFATAAFAAIVPIVILVSRPEIIQRPGVLEFGLAGYFFCGALETAVRMTYFHRRRRQIQIEEGTWAETPAPVPIPSSEFLNDLKGRSSNAHAASARAAVFGLAGSLIAVPWLAHRLLTSNHWILALLVVGFGIRGSYRWIRQSRKTPLVFDARIGTLAKFVAAFGVGTLLIFNLSWARGRMPVSPDLGILFNILVTVVYAALIIILAKFYRPLAEPVRRRE